jgi:hypothetical protein
MLNLRSYLPLLAAFVGLNAWAATAWAASEIVPVSYTFDKPTGTGTYSYYDGSSHTSPSFTELTDGKYGREGWTLDLGSGHAAEWVGWYQTPVVNIDFSFEAPVAIDSIQVGTTQDKVFDVVLPSLSVSYWTGSSWVQAASLTVPENTANNRSDSSTLPHGFLTLSNLGITASKVRVTAKHSLDGPWTFMDEVDIYGSAPVPEPASLPLTLLGLGVVAGALRMRQRA